MKLKEISYSDYKKTKGSIYSKLKKIAKYNATDNIKKQILRKRFKNEGYKFAVFANACSDSIARTRTEDAIVLDLVGIKIIWDVVASKAYKKGSIKKRKSIIKFALNIINIPEELKTNFLNKMDDFHIQPSIKMLKIPDERKETYSMKCHIFELFADFFASWLKLPEYKSKNLQLLFRYFAMYIMLSSERRYRAKWTHSLYRTLPDFELENMRTYFLDKIKNKSMVLAKDNFNLIYQAALVCEEV